MELSKFKYFCAYVFICFFYSVSVIQVAVSTYDRS